MSTLIPFTKMHGLGNDFVVVDGIHQSIILAPPQIRFIADRHRGIGCDQILLIEKTIEPTVDFNYRIFNADGSEVGQCGNGARCAAKFIVDHHLSNKKTLRLKTQTAMLECHILDNHRVQVNMGIPEKIRSVTIDHLQGLALDIGNPHVVFNHYSQQDKELYWQQLNMFGKRCNQHESFPDGVNVSFMQVIDRNTIQLRVYERGVGETQACGSGACAAVIAGIYQGLLNHQVTVELLGGKLLIEWLGNNTAVLMTGEATSVFQGNIAI